MYHKKKRLSQPSQHCVLPQSWNVLPIISWKRVREEREKEGERAVRERERERKGGRESSYMKLSAPPGKSCSSNALWEAWRLTCHSSFWGCMCMVPATHLHFKQCKCLFHYHIFVSLQHFHMCRLGGIHPQHPLPPAPSFQSYSFPSAALSFPWLETRDAYLCEPGWFFCLVLSISCKIA